MTSHIWVRLGDADNYSHCDDLADAAEYLDLFGVHHVCRSQKYGVEAEGLTGQNYISLFYGDDDAQPTRELTDKDIRFLNAELGRLFSCTKNLVNSSTRTTR